MLQLGEIKMESIGKVVKYLLGHGLKPFDTKKAKDKVRKQGIFATRLIC